MKSAWRTSSGNFWKLFVSIIVFFTIPFGLGLVCAIIAAVVLEWDMDLIPGTLLFNAGLVPTIAFLWLGSVLAYLQLTGQPNCLGGQH